VILAAGALATPLILRTAGLPAGAGFFCDPLVMVMGTAADVTGGEELAMAGGFLDEAGGYMLADMTIPAPFYRVLALAAGRPDRVGAHAHTLTVMVKIRDEVAGGISPDGRPFRRFGAVERQRMAAGVAVARRVLAAAGARHVFVTRWTAAHPGGTAPLGRLVDAGLETACPGLYVCDASVIPGPWGRPPTLTLLALGKYLAGRLSGRTQERAERGEPVPGSGSRRAAWA
ncbi:MAG: GMC oxidoreductase, partial [Firmicutes bacterium]|nr:GMC oxidoreductase [Bacillota bacterium]